MLSELPSCGYGKGLVMSVSVVIDWLQCCPGVGEGFGVLGCSSRGWHQDGDQCSGPTHQGMDSGLRLATACLPFSFSVAACPNW